MFEQLAVGRERGWITAEGEIHVGMCAVGAPVKLAGRPVAGFTLGSLCPQLSDERFEELGPLVQNAATEIGLCLAA